MASKHSKGKKAKKKELEEELKTSKKRKKLSFEKLKKYF